MTETEYAVRLEHGVIVERPSRELAERMAEGVISRGGTAVLVTRRVTRTEWAEDEAEESEESEERAHDLGAAPDYKCFIEDHAACARLGYDAHCTCACHKTTEATR